MARPMFAREMRSTRMAEATRMAKVLACDRRSETVQTETTHAIASLRCMINSIVDCAWVGHPSPLQAGSVYFWRAVNSCRESGDDSELAGAGVRIDSKLGASCGTLTHRLQEVW